MTASTTLQRATFRTNRMMDFCSQKELIAQTGHEPTAWPLVVLKELVDNALDACEETGVQPKILVRADHEGISVSDNGPGIPAATVNSILDFSVRVSSREAYVAPDRGAQGNALKTILAIPFVLDNEIGQVVMDTGGIRHEISFSADTIRQEPVVAHEQYPGNSKNGTTITVKWPDSAIAHCWLSKNLVFYKSPMTTPG